MLCAWVGHAPKVTAVIETTPGTFWHQQTCLRCGATRQVITHPWGTMQMTPWVPKDR